MSPVTIWFTGLSASGKTTLSEALYKNLKELGITNVELIDGEDFRDKLNDYNFDKFSREQIGILKAKMALELNKQGKIVIVSGIAHKKKWRDDIRKMFDNYFEVYLECDVNDCSKRDYKGHYDKAFAGELKNFVGVDEAYERSNEFDLILYTGRDTIEVCSDVLLTKVKGIINI